MEGPTAHQPSIETMAQVLCLCIETIGHMISCQATNWSHDFLSLLLYILLHINHLQSGLLDLLERLPTLHSRFVNILYPNRPLIYSSVFLSIILIILPYFTVSLFYCMSFICIKSCPNYAAVRVIMLIPLYLTPMLWVLAAAYIHRRSLCWLCSWGEIASDSLTPFHVSICLSLSIFLKISPFVVEPTKRTLMERGLAMLGRQESVDGNWQTGIRLVQGIWVDWSVG